MQSLRPLLTLGLISIIVPVQIIAQNSGSEVVIEQSSANGMIGEWTLIKPDNKRVTIQKEYQLLKDLPEGQYTLLVDPPSGASTSIQKFFENDLIDTLHTPQISFAIESGMHITLRLNYTFTRVGIVSVSSDPSGLTYSIIGPNGFNKQDTTPNSYPDMPEGQYSVTFTAIEDCTSPPPLSDKLVKDSRINFTITIACENLQNTAQQQEKNLTFEYVNTIIDGQTIIFRDTLQSAWFAPYVHTILKTGVMSGYKDTNGVLTGKFGPGNNVTLAELLKIAHELANIEESIVLGVPANSSARGTWFEKHQKSAENLHWRVYIDNRTNLGRNATRGEVVATLIQALEIPRLWPTGSLFSDVKRSTHYASSIETAALDGLVSGYEDGGFRPESPINRAEISKIISNAISLYLDQ